MTTQKQQLLDKGWEFHGVEWSDWTHGIMVSPELAVHDDWMDCIKEWDDYLETPISYYFDYIENLINSPVFAGDNDWSEHIIKLEE